MSESKEAMWKILCTTKTLVKFPKTVNILNLHIHDKTNGHCNL